MSQEYKNSCPVSICRSSARGDFSPKELEWVKKKDDPKTGRVRMS
jgi:hypothetical protein